MRGGRAESPRAKPRNSNVASPKGEAGFSLPRHIPSE